MNKIRVTATAVTLCGALAGPVPAHAAAQDPERELAERFAPVVRLVTHDAECGPGEPYQPSDVDVFLGDDSVALRGPWTEDDLIRTAPTGSDLAPGLFGYHLDFPGNPLRPGCDYEQWAALLTEGSAPTVYAHVATEQGRDGLALQYWLYYPFNDYNNKHESDWEMIQLLFSGSSPEEALGQEPVEVGYSQHEGLEVASWDDEKLDLVDGTHPVVFPAAGSHANYYDPALHLGRSSQQGFGCDDTRNPADALELTVQVIPNDPAAAEEAFPWIAYQGRWGQREAAFYNGPTGPNTKDTWLRPISAQEEEGHDNAYAVPAGGLFGTGATDFFCDSVAGGSNLVRVIADNPAPLLVVLALVLLLAVQLVRHTTWRPATPLHVGRRRSGGQIIASASRIYISRWRVFVAIGAITVPAFVLASALQTLLVTAPEVGEVGQGGEDGGWRVFAAAVLTYAIVGYSVVLVHAATIHALLEIDAGRPVTSVSAYRLSGTRLRSLAVAFLVSSLVVALCTLTLVLTPVAVVLVILLALGLPVIVIEQRRALAALRESIHLVRRQFLKVAVILLVVAVAATLLGPLLGTGVILAADAPFPLANLIAGVTFAFLMPWAALTIAYLYADARVREVAERKAEPSPQVLPAELDLGG